MSELNVYKFWRPVRFYLSRPWKIVSDFFKCRKWASQRARRGYADTDVWDMDDWFLRVLPPMLRDLANDDAYPGNPPFETEDKWTAWLNRMADDFESLQENWGFTRNEYDTEYQQLVVAKQRQFCSLCGNKCLSGDRLTPEERELQRKWKARIEELQKEKFEFTKQLFAELAEHFYNLWS